MSSFNYHLLYSSCGCQEGKKLKFCLMNTTILTATEKKKRPFYA